MILILLSVMCLSSSSGINIGTPTGYLTDCPGWNSTTTISPETVRSISVIVHRTRGSRAYRMVYRFPRATNALAGDPRLDLAGKRTLVFFDGYLSSITMPHNRALAAAYSRRHYNVIQLQMWPILLRLYPVAARLAKPVGNLMGEFLADLFKVGLRPDSLELLGVSLGAHTVAFAAERFHQLTGKRPARITGLGPAGPCFREGVSLRPILAVRVHVLHTNVDGFGIVHPLGHVDKPSTIGGFIFPCLLLCSHVRSFVYWWMAVENPNGFLASQCESLQDTRRRNCYGGERATNVLGLNTDFNKTGIFYLPTRDAFPYYVGREGLEKKFMPTSFLKNIVPSGNLLV